MNLTALPDRLGICRLDPDAALPDWLSRSAFFSVTRTPEELSVITAASALPEGLTCSRGWRCFRVEGPLDFSLTGVLASLAAPLAEAGISIFAVSTHDTDYVLVREAQFEEAARVLAAAGHRVAPADAEGTRGEP